MEPPHTHTTAAPEVDCEQHHASLAVSDVRAAVEFYTTKLGFWSAFTEGDPPSMAGVNLGRVQIFLERGTPSPQGCSVYFVVGDADELYDFHRSRGVEIAQPLDDRPYGLRDYTVRDLHGYHLSFGHRVLKAGPPIKVERVDVSLRLEKRLVALLHDLAKHKRMSLSRRPLHQPLNDEEQGRIDDRRGEMKTVLCRGIGFSAPTLVLVTVLHLVEDVSVGEAIDGLVSGLWFAGLYFLGALLRIRLGLSAGAASQSSVALEVLEGMAAAVLTWALVWLIWTIPQAEQLRKSTGWTFVINSATVFVVALSLPPLRTRPWRSA